MSQNFPFEQFIKFNQDKDIEKTQEAPKTSTHQNNLEIFSKDEMRELSLEIKQNIKKEINEDKFNTYFNDTFCVSKISSDTITCFVATNFLKKAITNHYLDFLTNSIENTLGKKYHVNIETSQIDEAPKKEVNETTNAQSFSQIAESLKPTKEDLHNAVESQVIRHFNKNENDNDLTGLLKNKTFENFVSGPSNKMSYAASLAVSNRPGEVYPSLYIHGGSGLGKTHLLHAIGNHILDANPRAKIVLTSASAFTNEMVNHLQNKTLPEFRKKYSEDIDVLMIDDIHELKNRSFTQDEFFHVFNELYKNKKQLIFTSDKHPNKIDGITERIKTRLYWGLVTEVQQPDFETRIAILKQKALDSDIILSDDVANIIAGSIKNNIRELEGSLIKLGAYSSINNINIDIELAKEILNLDENNQKELDYEQILKAVSDFYEIPSKDILGKSRIKEIANARHISMYFCYSHMKATLKEIAHYFGGRDHTSVLHAVKKIQSEIKDNGEKASQIYEIESRLI